MIEAKTLERFKQVFGGRADAWGVIHGLSIQEEVTKQHYVQHLVGKTSLGIYPLLDDGKCRWATVDIDVDDLDLAVGLREALCDLGLNVGVYIERSKSKGHHVWLLFDAPVSAKNVRRILRTGLTKAGLDPGTEIFPKQDSLDEETPLGNYVNLPYFGNNGDGKRCVLRPDTLAPMPVEEFIDGLRTFPASSLGLVLEALPPEEKFERRNPPGWLGELMGKSIPTGQRRPTLTKIAGAYRVGGIDVEAAVIAVTAWAEKAFEEPLPVEKIEKTVRDIYERYGTRNTPNTDNGERRLNPESRSSIEWDSGFVSGEGGERPFLGTLRVLEVADLTEPGPRLWRVRNLVPESYPTSVYGDGGQGKSLIALAVGTVVTTGRSFLGMPTIKGKTLYLDWELDPEEFTRRAYQVARGMGMDGPPVDLLYANVSLPLLQIKGALENEVRTRGIEFLIIDSLGAAAGGNPNAAELVIPTFQMLRDLGKASLVIDHQSKLQEGQHYENKTAYGNAYKGFLSRSVWQIEKGESEDQHTLELLMRPKKANFGPLVDPVGVRIRFAGATIYIEHVQAADVPGLAGKLPIGDQVLAELREGEVTVDELAELTGKPRGTIRNQLTRLRKAGKVITLDGTWRLIPNSHSPIGRESGIVSGNGLSVEAEKQGWPAVSLGQREVNNRVVQVGVPAGRTAWEQVIRTWPDDRRRELMEKLMESRKEHRDGAKDGGA